MNRFLENPEWMKANLRAEPSPMGFAVFVLPEGAAPITDEELNYLVNSTMVVPAFESYRAQSRVRRAWREAARRIREAWQVLRYGGYVE